MLRLGDCKIDSGPRPLRAWEIRLVAHLLGVSFSGSEQLRIQLDRRPLVKTVLSDCTFEFITCEGPSAACANSIPIQGYYDDAKGSVLFLLHVGLDGFLAEVEVIVMPSRRVVEIESLEMVHVTNG